ncbi:hypothetical protein [Cellulophaga lytica]|uniref:Uncharacterized protein n=1 Tax=Cellulophaga lytica (strain ATCC 23178 / DSM 7489 / JCM 8516 / NBRC 14961 / NCIMB 1423 / VKM B-1433 / Cy l20) TaxID=867900 RepID=F0RIG8_CELLC|nr:hypothetical protein [Cellulophaga lytica]ADY29297.1 hypothetical protein Celly_1472 [Cellulophaga lytica DSM 7489]WQG76528.1 hypothetical protein SR888_12625 [Cellulophaga lytica]
MFSNQIPEIFSILFLLAFMFPVVMVARLAKKGKIKNGFWLVLGFYIPYLIIVAIASLYGFFDDVMLPPKIVLTTTLPLAIFVTIIYNTEICKKANTILNLEDLVKIHIFRLIGSTFIILFLYDLLPPVFALFAGIGDLLTAISSIFVAKAIRNKKNYARKLTYIWNTFGLVDILITSAMAIIFTKISIDNSIQGVEFLAEFPFCFIPAFAPPTIIFLHLLVFRKLSWLKKA